MAMVGWFFTKFKKETTRQQSTEIKLHRLLATILILRLVLRYCWLVVVLGQNERCHGRLDAQQFLLLLCDAQLANEEAFFKQFARAILKEKKELQGWIWRKIGGRLFFMNI
jgi:hypothetical protein